jgi:hypothetical protein
MPIVPLSRGQAKWTFRGKDECMAIKGPASGASPDDEI